MPSSIQCPGRRQFLRDGVCSVAALAVSGIGLLAQSSPRLEVACAGSIRAMLDGPLKAAASQSLGLDLYIHSGGADAVARAIVDGSQPADVFIPITEGPMRTLMNTGKARIAYPIARTEMVILYSAKSHFASQFAAAAEGNRNWWEVLQKPGLKFARSNPADDPSGRSILFTMMLAAKKYGRPDLVQRVLGTPLNPAQVQPGTNVRAGLESGSIDAAGSYRIATGRGKLRYIVLPADLNLSDLDVRKEHPEVSFTLGEKIFYPEPLVFYAAALTSAANPQGAMRFLNWLRGQQAKSLLQQNGFQLPGYAPTLHNA